MCCTLEEFTKYELCDAFICWCFDGHLGMMSVLLKYEEYILFDFILIVYFYNSREGNFSPWDWTGSTRKISSDGTGNKESKYTRTCQIGIYCTEVNAQLLFVQQFVLCTERPFLLEKKTEEIRKLTSLFLNTKIYLVQSKCMKHLTCFFFLDSIMETVFLPNCCHTFGVLSDCM